MNIKTKNILKRKFVNFFGAGGYFLNSLQWLWVVLLYSGLITEIAKTMGNKQSDQVVQSTQVIDVSQNIPMLIITAGITIAMILLSIYIILKIPSSLVKTSKKVVRSSADNATNLILQAQKKDTKKNHMILTPLVIIVMKILLIIIPVILVFTSQFIEKQIFDFYISIYIGGLLACFSLLFFVFQYLIAGILSVKNRDLW
jgi:hypothetical protein